MSVSVFGWAVNEKGVSGQLDAIGESGRYGNIRFLRLEGRNEAIG